MRNEDVQRIVLIKISMRGWSRNREGAGWNIRLFRFFIPAGASGDSERYRSN